MGFKAKFFIHARYQLKLNEQNGKDEYGRLPIVFKI